MFIKRVTKQRTAEKVSQHIKEFNGLDVSAERILSVPHFVAVDEGKIIGGFGVGRTTAFSKEIFHLYTLPEHRGQGVGKACIRYATEHTKKAGKQILFATVHTSNEVSIFVFMSAGFRLMDTYHSQTTNEGVAIMHKSVQN
jgi:ribosomal protein S18 acetylase RimI-like enzyme